MIEYGIQEIKMTAANADGSFPDFDNNEVKIINLIACDSFREDQEADKETNLFVEDSETPVSTIVEKGAKTITFQTHDLSQEQCMYLMGFTIVDGYLTENNRFVLPSQAMRLITKPIDIYPSKIREWAKLDVKVKRTGTVGKNGLPSLQLDMKIPSSMDFPVYREKNALLGSLLMYDEDILQYDNVDLMFN